MAEATVRNRFLGWALALVAVAMSQGVLAREDAANVMIEGAGGVPLRVVESGNRKGPTILFIHGMSQSTLSFEPQFESDLAERFQLIAFDLRGHGGSAKPWRDADYAGSQIWAADVAAVIDALDLDDVTIVAWSFGGAVAVSYIRHYGFEKVRGLNLIGTTGGLTLAVPPDNGGMEKAMDSTRQRTSVDLAENIAGYSTMPNGLTAQPMDPAARATSFYSGLMHPSYSRRLLGDLPLDNRDMASRMTIPVLLSIGTKDIGMDVDSARALDAALPQSTLSLYDGDGHFPSYESADRYNSELADFVQELAARAPAQCKCRSDD